MKKRQLLALFVSSLVLWAVGNGLTPLLPVYALRLGADSTSAGFYLALSNITLAAGALAAGWISARFRSHKIPFILAALASIPLTWLIGRAGNMWSLSLLTAAVWAFGGLSMALVAILTGFSAGEHERGKIFGILFITNGLGALVGGLSSGFIADRWGYPSLFSLTALFMIVLPLAGLFLSEPALEAEPSKAGTAQEKQGLGKRYRLLFSAGLVAAIAGYIAVLARFLVMNDLEFGAFAISSTSAVGGLVSIPIPLLIGWLSDRSGRKLYLLLAYLTGIASLLVLALAASLWSFYFASILLGLFVGVSGTVGNAWVTDLLPPASLGRGLALFSATAWIGGILGFAAGGYALQNLGMNLTLLLAAGLFLVAGFLGAAIRPALKGGENLAGTQAPAG